MSAAPLHVPHGDGAIETAVTEFRQKATTVVLKILAVMAVLLLLLYIPAMLAVGAFGVLLLAVLLVGTTVMIALRSTWSLRLRVGWVVINLWLSAVPGVFTGGDRGVFTANLLGSVATAAILLGWREAVAVVSAMTALFLAAAVGHAAGLLPLGAVARLDPDSALGWIGLLLTALEIATITLVGSTLMHQRFRGLVGELERTVSRREEALAALTHEREERSALSQALADTLVSLRTGLWELDLASGQLTDTGDMRRLFGCPTQVEVLSEDFLLSRVHPDDRVHLAAVLREDRASMEFRVVAPGAATRWLRATTTAVTDETGRARRVRGLVVDVTAERAHELQRKRLSEVASRTGNPVVITDLEGRIEWVNEAFTRLTGWVLDEVEGKRPGSILQGPHTDPAVRARMARAIAAREPFECEVLNVSRSGRQYWVHIEARVSHDETGAPTGFVAVETDITERRIAAHRDSLAERVAALLLKSDSVREAGERLVRELVVELDVRTAQLWIVEPAKTHLTYVAGAASSETGEAGQRFLAKTRTLTFSQGENFVFGVGVPGTSWYTGATAVLPVIGAVGSRRLAAAEEAGVISFCGTPILGPEGVLGVLEVGGTAYYPGHELLPTLLERVAEQMASFLLHEASRRAFQHLFDRSPDGILVVGEDGVVTDANSRAATLFAEPVRRPVDALLQNGAALVHHILEASSPSADDEAALSRCNAVGAVGSFSAEVSASRVVMGTRRGAIIAVRDLTERHRMESALTQSLREKETLLREVHHRVKNNLQIVSSLLSLQADGMEPGPARESLHETVLRVRSMSTVHQQLYGTENLDSIDFGSYAQTLCKALLDYLDPHATIAFEVEPITVSIDRAVPCGLVLNELVINALKHGRSPQGTCDIRVIFRREPGAVILRVSDRGPGFSSDAQRPGSFGMPLLKALSRQLGATLEIRRDEGASVTVRIKRALHPQDGAAKA